MCLTAELLSRACQMSAEHRNSPSPTRCTDHAAKSLMPEIVDARGLLNSCQKCAFVKSISSSPLAFMPTETMIPTRLITAVT
eukprot:scaffold222462_cov30-Tisochrysis_lutea.AAC.3